MPEPLEDSHSKARPFPRTPVSMGSLCQASSSPANWRVGSKGKRMAVSKSRSRCRLRAGGKSILSPLLTPGPVVLSWAACPDFMTPSGRDQEKLWVPVGLSSSCHNHYRVCTSGGQGTGCQCLSWALVPSCSAVVIDEVIAAGLLGDRRWCLRDLDVLQVQKPQLHLHAQQCVQVALG